MENTKTQHPLVTLGLILGGSFLVAVILGAITVFQIRGQGDLVSVTGSAKIQVTSDQAKWTADISRTVRESELKTGYQQMSKDMTEAKAFILGQGIAESELTISAVSMNEVYQQNQSAEKLYNLTQTFTTQSADVNKLTSASNNIAQIIDKGVIFSTRSVDYYYSKLPEARIELLSAAIDDAKLRAGEIAKNSGKGVGSLKSASSGVVQVQSLNSTDVSDYGGYDTSQIEKQITVTVKAAFTLR